MIYDSLAAAVSCWRA